MLNNILKALLVYVPIVMICIFEFIIVAIPVVTVFWGVKNSYIPMLLPFVLPLITFGLSTAFLLRIIKKRVLSFQNKIVIVSLWIVAIIVFFMR